MKPRKPKWWPARPPDQIIGEPHDPYLLRWYVIPRNSIFNVYLHEFRHSDDERALHDHPWVNCSVLVSGQYREVLNSGEYLREEGAVLWRSPSTAHRVVLVNNQPCWTIFVTGPKVRRWGFHCPQGWRHCKEFVQSFPGGNKRGKGCD